MTVLILIFNFYSLFFLSNGLVLKNLFNTSNYDGKLTSESLREYVDLNGIPCDNFYKFSCGNWIKTREVDVGYSEHFNNDSRTTVFDNFIKEFFAGKLNDESAAIKKIYNIRKKCEQLSVSERKRCEDKILTFAVYALSSLFIKKSKMEREKYGDYIIMNDMIKRFKEEFELLIDEKRDIFDKESRDNLLKKLFEVEFTRNFDKDDTTSLLLMEKCYESVEISENDDIEQILKNIKSLSKKNHVEYSCSDKMFNVFGYLAMAIHKNAGYHAGLNKFTISSSALKEHWFSRYFPQALNYGGIGFIIAHEMLHAFDDQNYKLIYGADEEGKLIVTPESMKKFEEKLDCFVKQYSVEKESLTNINVNGLLTLTENIADNGGLKIAHRAYMKYLQSIGGEEPKVPGFENFTSEQLFFISFGRTFCEHKSKFYKEKEMKDDHTPSEIRINVALSNYKPFSDAFKCEVNSKMNPEGKCELWKNH
uniref:Phosphate-regulating neutral endopeptidase (inferred by orthology to a human protein) n=1 Tax=Strongyloides venezuelensis TaxID=75913 RepID=A0A0K0EUX1_STRVS